MLGDLAGAEHAVLRAALLAGMAAHLGPYSDERLACLPACAGCLSAVPPAPAPAALVACRLAPHPVPGQAW